MSSKYPTRLFFSGSLALLLACTPQPDPEVLATWRGGEVTPAQLDTLLSRLPAGRRQPPAGLSLEAWLEARIQDLVLPEALLERRGEADLEESSVLRLRGRYQASQEIGRDFLSKECPEDEIPEEELKTAFEESYSQGPRPWLLLRHIYKQALPSASPEGRLAVRREMEEVRRQLQAGANFLEMARRHSDSETAKEGGLIGRISRQAPLEPMVRDAAWELEDGTFSEILEVENGFHLLSREESGIEPPVLFEQARGRLRRQQILRRQEVCGREVLTRLGQKSPVTIDRSALASAEPAAVALRVGDEAFTLRQLAGLSQDGSPLALTPRPGESLRHFAEAVLLANQARAAAKDSETFAAHYQRLEERTLRKLLIESQWQDERLSLIRRLPETELRTYYETHQERFETHLGLDMGMILVTSKGASGRRGALEEAQKLAIRLRDGIPFEDLAQEYSEHGSREDHGRLGLLPVPRLRVILGSKGIAQASGLQPGEISPPVLIHDPPGAAYALLKLYERRLPAPRTFEEAREDIVTMMAQDQIQRLDREVRERVLEEVALRIYPEAIALYLSRLRG